MKKLFEAILLSTFCLTTPAYSYADEITNNSKLQSNIKSEIWIAGTKDGSYCLDDECKVDIYGNKITVQKTQKAGELIYVKEYYWKHKVKNNNSTETQLKVTIGYSVCAGPKTGFFSSFTTCSNTDVSGKVITLGAKEEFNGNDYQPNTDRYFLGRARYFVLANILN